MNGRDVIRVSATDALAPGYNRLDLYRHNLASFTRKPFPFILLGSLFHCLLLLYPYESPLLPTFVFAPAYHAAERIAVPPTWPVAVGCLRLAGQRG